MNKVIGFSILFISLFVIEILIGFILLVLFDNSGHDIDLFVIKRAWRGSGLWNYWRILFYGLPFIALKIVLFDLVRVIVPHEAFSLSVFNLFSYFLFSYLSILFFGENVPLPPEGIMFWITCLSIFISPLLLYFVPFFKRTMKEL
jgi:hypothetical protein